MAEAGAPKGSMYFHFPGGKEELAGAALDRFAERLAAAIAQGLAEADSVAGAVVAFFDAEIARMEASAYVDGCPVATVALDAAATHDALAASTGAAFGRWTDLLAEALVAEGRPADDARRAATLFLATFEGAMVLAKAQRSTEPLLVARDAMALALA
jgi:TetR/AcrR family transcriptional repressor of lmrAB and yxaGH operons